MAARKKSDKSDKSEASKSDRARLTARVNIPAGMLIEGAGAARVERGQEFETDADRAAYLKTIGYAE